MTITTVSSLGVLAVTVAVKQVDILSTVALVLAILAFISQLVISIAQSQSSQQQLLQSERVNTDTQALLSTVQATVDSLLVTSKEQFALVLKSALDREVPAALHEAATEEAKSGSSELDERIVARLTETLGARLSEYIQPRITEAPRTPRLRSPGARSAAVSATREVTPRDRRIAERLRTYPETEEEAGPLLDVYSRLSSQAREDLEKLGRDEAEQRPTGGIIGLRDLPADGELRAAELVTGGDFDYIVLTSKGRAIARLVTSDEEPPDWLRARLESLD